MHVVKDLLARLGFSRLNSVNRRHVVAALKVSYPDLNSEAISKVYVRENGQIEDGVVEVVLVFVEGEVRVERLAIPADWPQLEMQLTAVINTQYLLISLPLTHTPTWLSQIVSTQRVSACALSLDRIAECFP